jgi:repressor LexA
MVAAWLLDREETTLKYFFREGTMVRLQPANESYDPITVPADQVEIQGKVIAIVRRLE